ncbi:hypothetical protein Pmani_029164 [Petrolisthes manimaculis]|uniref:C3H1-type domain-containing protein n=1 Tax=Petrolisthes manimaculis TaxID=1843537 RepID=A0AAE1NYL4_9EUCA|nr:hypothetical protein Pmani_029164 [Petrolisthes manimaculis]
MEGVGTEVSHKIRSAIKAKLVELGTYVGKDVTLQLNEELPDYIMVLVANKKTKDQMDDDLSLFLGHNTERFTSWLHHVLQKLNAAALLQVTTPQEEPKKKEPVEEKRKDKEDKREKVDKKREVPIEEVKRSREEERHSSKEKDKLSRKRKNSEKKKDKKEKKLKRKDSSPPPPPPPPERESKERRVPVEVAKPVTKVRELTRELESKEQEVKEKKSKELKEKENKVENEKEKESKEKENKGDKENSKKKVKPLTAGNKVSSADIFRAEAGGEEEDVLEEDMLVLRAEDELGLELEDEPTPKKSRGESREKIQQKVTEVKPVVKELPKTEKTESEPKEKKQRVSVKDRLGAPVTSTKAPVYKDKVSVMSRVSVGASGRRVVNLREESGVGSGSRREEAGSEGTAGNNAGLARAVSSAITSACRSVCVLPSTTASGKKLEARVRPLMSREVVSSASGGGTARTSSRESSSRSETVREGIRSEVASNKEGSSSSRSGEASSRESIRGGAVPRAGSSRVVSAVGAVLKRSHSQAESDEEEYDPKKPQLGGMASKVEVAPRPRRLGAIQANTALILRAVADAHKSVTRPQANQPKAQKPVSKVKQGELFTRSYREREEARHKEVRVKEEGPEVRMRGEGEEVRIRKIAITVPNAARKESERQLKEEEMKEEEEEGPHIPEALSVKKEEDVPMKQEEPQPEMSTSPLPDNVYNVEEMEEVEEEEEVVMEMSPPVMIPEPAAVNENTKFIVTLEGVDEGGDLRERLGNRIPQTQIEEYIEEVEEWEEEEEEVTSDPGSIQPTSGLNAAKNNTSTIPISGVGKERCKYWPVCKSGESCPYHHPTVSCKSFPGCKFGDKCLFIHPNCLYDAACTRIGCPYTHASARNFALASVTANQKHKVMAPRSGPSKVKCKFFPKCTNMSCPFLHPKACFYGTSCTQAGCPFTHPAIPTGAKLNCWMLLISSKMQSPKLMINHCKNVQYHWKQVSGSVRTSAASHLHSSSVQCSTTSGDDYQYFHKSKTPSMHFQKSLLRLPIPDLDKTCTRYLRSQEAILTPEEYSQTQQIVAKFKDGPGADLQAKLKLKDKANKHTSYITGPWFNMYLSDRVPVVLNYNPFMAFTPETRPGYSHPVIRASNMLVSSLRFMKTLRDSVLEPVVYHLNPAKTDTDLFRRITRWTPSAIAAYSAYAFKAFPLDMSQFVNLFNSTRVPEQDKDRLKSDPKASHMLIMKNGHFYVFDVFDRDGNILSPAHIHACVSYIYNDETPPPKHSIAIFSSENRNTWASCRAELLAAGNEAAIETIDTAAFNIVFDDVEVGMDPTKMYHTFLHGNGKNRWFDKSFSLIFTADGQVALNFEHSWGDGVAVMSYINALTKDVGERPFIHPDSQPATIDASQLVQRLEFNLTPSLEGAIDRAHQQYVQNTSALQVDVLESKAMGKKHCKKQKVSPDAIMQLGFQAAYYMQNGEAVASYESCSTSAFKHGRTETIRPATLETLEFSKAVSKTQLPSNSELRALIQECSKVHGNLTKEAAMGQGFDRHLFGMRKIAESEGGELPALYTDPAYAKINHVIISTSTLPSTAIGFGGFAPVVRDGFGVGYQIQDDALGLVVSSYPPHRDGAGFIECAQKAYSIIHQVISS